MSTTHHAIAHALPDWSLLLYGLATAARAGLKLASANTTGSGNAVNPRFSVRSGRRGPKLVNKLVDRLSSKWSDWRVPFH